MRDDPPGRGPSIAVLALLSGVGPFATDTYIAALPALRDSLGTTAAVAQLTLTAFIVGLALGQIVIGPISDARGRRSLLIVTTVVFAATSLLCVVAPNGPALVAIRLVQGTAAGGAVAIGRAVVSDVYTGAAAAQRYGTLASITFLAPVVAPAVGGLILAHGTWRTVFVFVTGLGVLMLVGVLVRISETLPAHRRQGAGLRDTLARMADLVRDWSFMKHVSVQALAAAAFFTYIGGSSFVLQTSYDLSPSVYAAVFAGNAAGMAAMSATFRFAVGRFGPRRLRAVGVLMSTAGAGALLVLSLVDRQGTASLLLLCPPLILAVAGQGLTIPASTALAQEAGRRSGGTASAVQGGISIGVGAAMTPITGVLGYEHLFPMAAVMTTFFAAALALLLVQRQRALGRR